MRSTAWIAFLLLAAGCSSRGGAGPVVTISPLAPGEVPFITNNALPVPTWRDRDATVRQSLDGTWRFLEDSDGLGDADLWYASDHDRDDWRSVEVPGVWNAAFPELLAYEGIGWYALEFAVDGDPTETELSSMMLRLGAVFLQSRIYLNDTLLGEHEGGYTPIHLETGGTLKRTGNVLVVRADNRIGWDTIPVDTILHLGAHGWWPYGGISRPVTLHDMPDPWIFKMEPAFVSADGDVEITLGLWAGSPVDYVNITFTLEGPGRERRSERIRLVVPESGFNAYRFEIEAGPPALWSREHPENLYSLTAEETTGGDGVTVRFGFRTFELAGDAMFLNGERDYWRGINRHSDYPDIGSVETAATISREVSIIGDLHANHVRPGHYPVDPRLLDALRDAGITILEEVPVYQLALGQMADPGLIAAGAHQLGEMIERDKNNPAVLAWSVGNEYWNFLPGAGRLTEALSSEARRLDPSRPVAAVIMNASCVVPIDFALDHVDLIGVNQYYGWYFGSLQGAGRCLDRIHEMYPDKPIVATEFGAGAVAGNHLAGEPGPEPLDDHGYTEEWQAWFLAEQFNLLLDREYLSGTMPWVMADFRMEWFPGTGNPHPVVDMNLKGLLSQDRVTRKLSFDVVAGIYVEGVHAK